MLAVVCQLLLNHLYRNHLAIVCWLPNRPYLDLTPYVVNECNDDDNYDGHAMSLHGGVPVKAVGAGMGYQR